jgi:fatty acid desaturase
MLNASYVALLKYNIPKPKEVTNMSSQQNIMPSEPSNRRIAWYKSPISREALAALNQRSDWKGLAQALGHLGLLVVTGAAAWYAAERFSLWVLLLILFLHGTFFSFLGAGFHELSHQTVFKTKALNTVFLHLVSWLAWSNPVWYWASHQEHHKYTLHPPDDLEVVLPYELTLKSFLRSSFVNPWDFYYRLRMHIRLSLGRIEGQWEENLFPPSAVALRRKVFTWARLSLLGHLLVVGVSLYFGLWLLPILVTLGPFYGGCLVYLCSNTQHAGLQDNVADFRLCTRTFLVNPFVQFLYWHMNYHIDHHMYAAVPCYNLSKLHAQIKHDLPHCPVGLIATWKEIIAIVKQQKIDPHYQYVAELPAPRAV